MDFIEYLKDAWRIVTFDEKSMLDISKDKESLKYGVIIMLAVAIIGALAAMLTPDITPLDMGLNFIILPVMFIVGSLVTVGIYHLSAKLFGGVADFMSLYKPFLFTYILSILLIFPLPQDNTPLLIVLGIVYLLVSIWAVVVSIFLVRAVHKLSTGKAIAAVLIPIGILIVIIIAIMAYTFMYLGQA